MIDNENLHEKDELLKLFDEGDRSYIRRLVDMCKGFGAPKGSLERKQAWIEFQRLGAPISAVVIVGLAIMAMILIKFSPPETKTVASAKVEEVEEVEEPEEEPPEEKPLEEPIELEEIVDVEVPIEIDAPPTTAIEQSPQPVSIEAVAHTPSPVSINVRTSKETGLRGAKIGALKGVRTEPYVVGFLRFLATQQGSNGLWDNDLGASSLALLVYLAHGEVPGVSQTGEFDEVVRKAIEGLLGDLIRSPSHCVYKAKVEGPAGYHDKCSDKVGLFKSRDKTNYSHMIAIYALAEAYAMTNIPDIKDAIEIALEPLLAGQTKEGGWYYNLWPKYNGADQVDSSFTSWAVQALKAAKLAKIRMPKENGSGDRIVEALKKAALSMKEFKNDDGSFGYINGNKKRQHLGLTAPCALILQLLDMGTTPDCQKALAYMTAWEPTFALNHKPKNAKYKQGDVSPQYYCYYLSQVRYNQGMSSADWKHWDRTQQALYSAAAIVIPAEKSGYKDHEGKAQQIVYWGLATGDFQIGGTKSTDKARLEKQEGTKNGKRGSYAIDELLCRDFGNHSWLEGSASRKRVISGCFTALQLTAYYRYSPLQKGALTKIEEEEVVEIKSEGGLTIEGLDDL